MEQLTRRSGYVYGRGTKAGFERMKRMGIPRPLFRFEDKITRRLKKARRQYIVQMVKSFRACCSQCGLTMDGDENDLEALMKFFEDEGEMFRAQEAELAFKMNYASAIDTFSKAFNPEEWTNEDFYGDIILSALKGDQKETLKQLFADADGRTQGLLVSFSIDKQKLFDDNMAGIRRLYLDNSLERIKYEQEEIKRDFLKRLNAYVSGEAKRLDFQDIVRETTQRGDNMSRFFIRDQLARFNKATTLATFEQAGVTKVKWVTCHDVRVRKSHKKLDGKVFSIHDLPEEMHDYNCRCGLVPVEWGDIQL